MELPCFQQSLKGCFAKAASKDLEDSGHVSTMKLYERSCSGYKCGKITPSNASKSPDLGTTVLSENSFVCLACVIWDGLEPGWRQAPSERSPLDASADTAVAG